MDQKLLNVIRIVSELQNAMEEYPDVLTAYVTKWSDKEHPQVQLYKGHGVEFTDEKKHGNGMAEKSTVINGVRVLTVYWDGD